MSRLLVLLVTLLALALSGPAWAQAGSPGAEKPTGSPPTGFTGEAYVGMTADHQIAVAVVIGAGTGDDREVRVYICDGIQRNIWLVGRMSGDAVEVEPDGESSLTATLGNNSITGSILIPNGQPLSFTADLATGPAGLYDVVIDEDGQIDGVATDGRRLFGRVAMQLADGYLLIAALIELPNDRVKAVSAIATADAAGEHRWIAQADGSVIGGSKREVGTGFAFGDGSVRITDGTSNT